jgi:hypothetical protein
MVCTADSAPSRTPVLSLPASLPYQERDRQLPGQVRGIPDRDFALIASLQFDFIELKSVKYDLSMAIAIMQLQ